MNPGETFFAVLVSILFLSGLSSASDVDAVLDHAKRDGKVVMLELGSIGCIPCEQMKPVMQKLRDTYKGKLEVIFVNVHKDHEAGRRFRVYLIPTQVFLDKDGNEFHRHIGFYAYDEIALILKTQSL